DLSPRSIARKISALKQFYQFCLREGKMDANPSELLTIRVKHRKLPKHLSVEEMFQLLDAAAGENDAEVRDRALLELWYATGSRVSELAFLKVDAINWSGAMVKIEGKGGRERLVPLHKGALAWCQRYRDIRHEWVRLHDLKETELFFLTRRGK